jgi:hypothetical protein
MNEDYSTGKLGAVRDRSELDLRIDTLMGYVNEMEPMLHRLDLLGDRLRGASPVEVANKNNNQTDPSAIIPRMDSYLSRLANHVDAMRSSLARLESII